MKSYISIFFIFICSQGFAQNIIPNPGFEEQESCDSWSGLVDGGSAPFWNSPNTGSSDLYNLSCFPSGSTHTGIGSAGIVLYNEPEYREYLQTSLLDTLSGGRIYCVEFYVSNLYFSIETSSIGVYFSEEALNIDNNLVLADIQPQFLNNSENALLSESDNFDLISFEYTANGGEGYMTIGNFLSDDESVLFNEELFDIPFSYYYIDDVSVEECNPISTLENTDKSSFKVYPNPSNDIIYIDSEIRDYSYEVMDLKGEVVRKSAGVNSSNLAINLGALESGVYIIFIQCQHNLFQKRIVID